MTQDEIIKLIEDNGLTLHGDIEHYTALVIENFYAKYLEQPTPNQSGVVSITLPEPIGYLCENAVGHKYFRWKKPSSTYKPVALYTTPPQRTWIATEKALKEALAQPEQEPLEYWNAVEGWVKIDEVREHFDSVGCGTIYKTAGEGREPLYTTPPQRTWVGLTESEKSAALYDKDGITLDYDDYAETIEAKLKEKNT